MNNYVFGPVPSRRLGRSLGIDLVPLKTCTYDCIYCQLGRTSHKVSERREWVPMDAVLAQLAPKLSSNPDYITLSGSGEPTLFAPLDRLIDSIKEMTDIPLAVLTNGSLLWREDVRRQLRRADVVMPTLAAADEPMFHRIHRPHTSLSFKEVVDGLLRFREEFVGQYWLEVFLMEGLNDSDEQIAELSRCVDRIGPGRVQLNTIARPPAELAARSVSHRRLAELALRFNPPAMVIADFSGIHQAQEFAAGRDEVLALLLRRPCTVEGVCEGLGLHRNTVLKHLETLVESGQAEPVGMREGTFYRAVGERRRPGC